MSYGGTMNTQKTTFRRLQAEGRRKEIDCEIAPQRVDRLKVELLKRRE